ncbi:hypothetical protein Tsubulata_007792 [Turnera subulata]|uniref:DUF1995 domain-containing protein n=1 Tax=Turnera subulata TaxID=218843 RepID=A0A9Q0FYN3_9ROSI|nr:hypothetical protein Tsubulata_007792 [Turnera subulata]
MHSYSLGNKRSGSTTFRDFKELKHSTCWSCCCSVSSDGNGTSSRVALDDVPFPRDYEELLDQAKKATALALEDGRQRSSSQQLGFNLYQFFPEANEVKFARESAFGGSSLKLDYLTKPSFFEDFGFTEKVKMVDRVKPKDELFLVAYPYFNVNEMLVVEELYMEAVVSTSRKLIIFNGELDRIRSGCILCHFYLFLLHIIKCPTNYPIPTLESISLASLTKTFLPMMETVYYIHNFKGSKGGTLFRCYPGPWKVFRRKRYDYTCVHQQEAMPSLKEVALEILPSA